MGSLRYRPDWLEARQRLDAWWHGRSIGRPILQTSMRRDTPWEKIPDMKRPEGWTSRYSSASLAYKVYLARRACIYRDFLGEACPAYASGDLAPNCLALYLGCNGIETDTSVWCEPCVTDPETADFQYDPKNRYWQFTLQTIKQTAPYAEGRFLQAFPDLIEGLDTLCALRGTDNLLMDLLERPEWVHSAMRTLTDLYFRYYDVLYEMIRDEVGGSHWWIWAPGRLVKIQCDMAAMISTEMFDEFMVPLITEMSERTAYSLFHLDGPDAIRHTPSLCRIPQLDMIQWQPGAGANPPWHSEWWPYLHQMLDSGKKIQIPIVNPYPEWHFDSVLEPLKCLKNEFGTQLQQFDLHLGVDSRDMFQRVLDTVTI